MDFTPHTEADVAAMLATVGADSVDALFAQIPEDVRLGRALDLPPGGAEVEVADALARLLDFYQIEWDYEPTSFDLEWDRDGSVVQRFTPDFYLPMYDLYIEITTLNQRLVTKKNRKVRRLRELYPGINCKIFYQRDYLSLVTKYGLQDARSSS